MTERPSVLVVDDEADMRALMGRILGRHYDVTAAQNAAQALDHLAAGGVQVALCDIRMADGGGLDLLREIVTKSDEVAVVMVTGVDDPAVADEALALGAYGYLLKPFTPSQLVITVASALRRRAAEHARDAAEQRTRELQLVAERDRIAGHLYREVMHDLFTIGLNLSGAAEALPAGDPRGRVITAIHDLDAVIARIRTTVLNPL